MALSIKDFYEYAKNEYAITLLTEEATLQHSVSWIYLLEDSNNLSFLREDNLVITTCMNLHQSEEALTEFVINVIEHNISGILFNVGFYVNQIPNHLITLCNQKNIPIFTMPWEIHIADVMQYFCNFIISEKRKREQLDHFLFHTLIGKSAILQASDKAIFSNGYLLASFEDLPFFYDATAQIEGIHYYYCAKLPKDASLPVGSSNIILHPKDLLVAKNQAYKALLTGKIKNTFPYAYCDIGLYNAVFAIQDKQVFEDARNKLAILDNPMTRDIFRYYLEYNGRIKELSEALFLHRNTVIYHVNKAKELLHITDNNSLLEYLFYFYLCDYDALRI